MSGTHNMLDRGYDRPIVDVRCSCGEQKAIDVHDKHFDSLMTFCHRCQQYTEQWRVPTAEDWARFDPTLGAPQPSEEKP